jgi:hypothetical protein
LVGCCVIPSSRSHRNPCPRRPLNFIFFFAPFATRNDGQTSSPPAFRPFESPLQRLPPRRHHPSVGCCVEQSSSGHPRPMLRPSCNFSMGAISAPQTRGQNAARARLDAGRLHQAHGEPRRCDLDPWRVYPWRGRAKPLGGRVTAAHLVSCAFLCEFCSVWRADILHTCLVLSIWGAGCPLIPEKCYIVGNKGTTVHFYVRDFSLRGTNCPLFLFLCFTFPLQMGKFD